MMEQSSEQFEVTKIINNLNQHNFTVQTYRMSKDEAEVVLRALKAYRFELEHDAEVNFEITV